MIGGFLWQKKAKFNFSIVSVGSLLPALLITAEFFYEQFLGSKEYPEFLL